MRAGHILFVLLSSLAVGESAGQTGGTFVQTGPLITPRSQHTATLLQTGEVLITGGAVDALGLASGQSVEIFDPATGMFRGSTAMTSRRRLHSATMLPDGRVLIAGGYDGYGPLHTAELYDPTTDTFTPTGNMVSPRGGHDAILLGNGTVVIAGGSDGSWPDIPTAEIYDPATGTFAKTGEYVSGPYTCDFCAPSVLLANGRVLFPDRSPALLYDPGSATFSATGTPGAFESAATLTMNGQVLFAGGEDIGRSNSAELFDPASGTFAETGSMGMPRVWHALTLLPDGTVMASGGETDACSGGFCMFAGTVANAEFYDPAAGKFTWSRSMTTPREGHTATVLNDGRVLIVGGVAYGGIGLYYGTIGTAELYTPGLLVPAPALLSDSASGRGGVIHLESRRSVSADDPAIADEVLELRCTGLNDGSIIPPRVTVGGQLAELLSVAAADSVGARALWVRMPPGITSGAVSLRLSYIGRWSNALTVAAR
jgi:hypothetical protein